MTLLPFRNPLSVDPPKVRILSSGPTARARSGKRHSELPCYESRASPPMRLSARVRSPFLRSDPNDCDSFYAHCRPNVIQFHNVFRILCCLIGLCVALCIHRKLGDCGSSQVQLLGHWPLEPGRLSINAGLV